MNKFLFKTSILFLLVSLALKTLPATELILELIDAKNLTLSGEKEPQNTVFTGETFRLKATVKNADNSTGDVTINNLEKLQLIGKSSSSNIVIINGKISADKSSIFDVCTDSAGAFEIGPAQVQQKGSIIKSNSIKFRSIKRPENFKETDSESSKSEGYFIKCELSTDKKHVFVGEPLTVCLKISFGGKLRICDNGRDMLHFDGFQEKELGKFEPREEVKDDTVCTILEKKYYLIPSQAGIQKIGPAKIIYQVPEKLRGKAQSVFNDDFFNFGGLFDQVRFIQKQTFSNNLQIQVLPISQNQENVDGVGKFTSFKCFTDKKNALLNEAIKLTLEIEGEGNFEQISTPKLILEHFIKNYESKTEFVEDPTNKPFAGKKIFEFIVQVGKTGIVTIPSQKFTYLDTQTKKIQSLQTEPIMLEITQPADYQAQHEHTNAQQNITPISSVSEEEKTDQVLPQNQEINFIEQEGHLMRKKDWVMPWWLLIILLFIPALFYTKITKKIFSKLISSQVLKKASKKASLSKFFNEFQKIKNNQKPDQLYSLFLNLLSVKFDLNLADISHEIIAKKLLNNGFDENKINDFLDFLNDCASLHFISSNQNNEKIGSSLFKKGEYWIILLTK